MFTVPGDTDAHVHMFNPPPPHTHTHTHTRAHMQHIAASPDLVDMNKRDILVVGLAGVRVCVGVGGGVLGGGLGAMGTTSPRQCLHAGCVVGGRQKWAHAQARTAPLNHM